jgi:hypothetical protein
MFGPLSRAKSIGDRRHVAAGEGGVRAHARTRSAWITQLGYPNPIRLSLLFLKNLINRRH